MRTLLSVVFVAVAWPSSRPADPASRRGAGERSAAPPGPRRAARRRREERDRPDLQDAQAGAAATRSPRPPTSSRSNYTGWTQRRARCSTAPPRGNPSTSRSNRVMPGWRECVQLMASARRAAAGCRRSSRTRDRPAGPTGHRRLRHRAAGHPAVADDSAARRGGTARGREADRRRPGLQGAAARQRRRAARPGLRKVTVHYTGWTTEGRMFDSSVRAARRLSMRLDEVIKGWNEGVQLMVEGERTAILDSPEPGVQGRDRPDGDAGVRHRARRDSVGHVL